MLAPERNLTSTLKKPYKNIVRQAKDVHGDRYAYKEDGDWYRNNKSKWEIKCSTHGWFIQSVSKHLGGQGCPSCRLCKKTGVTRRVSLRDIKKSLPPNLYIPEQNYKNIYSTLEVFCKDHGTFNIQARKLREGVGCRGCFYKSQRKSKEDYIKDFMLVHGDRYNYESFDPKQANTKATVVCKSHGPFLITPSKHKNGRGCPTCSRVASCWYNSENMDKNKLRFKAEAGFLYLVSIGDRYLKIGITKDINCRLTRMKKSLEDPLEVILTLKGNLYDLFYIEQEVLCSFDRGVYPISFEGWTETLNMCDIGGILHTIESLGSSGTGGSQEGGIASTTNVENKQLHQPLNLVAEDQGDYVALVDASTGDLFQTVDKT